VWFGGAGGRPSEKEVALARILRERRGALEFRSGLVEAAQLAQ
jgi:hypothetical protein